MCNTNVWPWFTVGLNGERKRGCWYPCLFLVYKEDTVFLKETKLIRRRAVREADCLELNVR